MQVHVVPKKTTGAGHQLFRIYSMLLLLTADIYITWYFSDKGERIRMQIPATNAVGVFDTYKF